jgi:sugar fermentation stimulation protein A
MKFATDLVPATLLRRYKRFLADVELADGTATTVHVANPGAMTGLQTPGSPIWLSRSSSATRKLPYSWELIEADFGGGPELAGVNTTHPNAIVAEALAAQAIPELRGYARTRREVKYGQGPDGGRSRIDFLLESPDRASCYVEVKNVHLMRRPGLAEFPDSVTVRGAKHLDELAWAVASGHRAVMLFVIQIGSAKALTLARDIDPAYGRAFDRACGAGVETIAHVCRLNRGEVVLAGPVPVLP